MNRRNKRQSAKNNPVTLIVGIVVAVVLIVLIVWLIRVVVISGAALLKDAGEAPIETQMPEEVWVSPTIDPELNWDGDDAVPEYVPEVKENEQFDQTGGEEDSVPVDAMAEDLDGSTPSPDEGNLFDPVDTDDAF